MDNRKWGNWSEWIEYTETYQVHEMYESETLWWDEIENTIRMYRVLHSKWTHHGSTTSIFEIFFILIRFFGYNLSVNSMQFILHNMTQNRKKNEKIYLWEWTNKMRKREREFWLFIMKIDCLLISIWKRKRKKK